MSDKSESFEEFCSYIEITKINEELRYSYSGKDYLEMAWDHQEKKIQAEREKAARVSKEYKEYKHHYDKIFSKSIVVPQDEYIEGVKKLQAEREKVALLREVVGDLIHHFNDYGMESEAIACLMAVKKARQTLEKLKEREGEE